MNERDPGLGLREGMTVYGADGVRMGRIVALGQDSFIVERGLVSREDFVARFDWIADVRDDGSVFLSVDAEAVPREILGTELHDR